ncbi:hypothetical protein GCK32_007620 [Trichostrongylus colubriformis]|uniref:Uncharacterized protein n=1 Tax=Trichostrongylus colubriformis TaxID=6319 RepID=A0AAN8FXQ9_TRICO
MSLTADGKTQAICDRFEVFDPDNRLLFFADSQEIGLNSENLRILDDGGTVFEGAIQTALVRPEPDTPLRLESPTRSVSVDAAQDIEIMAAAGEVRINTLLDVAISSKQMNDDEYELKSWFEVKDEDTWGSYRASPSVWSPFKKSLNEVTFTIGSDDCIRRRLDEPYCNSILRANVNYKVKLRAYMDTKVAMESDWISIDGQASEEEEDKNEDEISPYGVKVDTETSSFERFPMKPKMFWTWTSY